MILSTITLIDRYELEERHKLSYFDSLSLWPQLSLLDKQFVSDNEDFDRILSLKKISTSHTKPFLIGE